MNIPTKVHENALEIKYVKILKLFLWSLGAWPGELFGEKVPFIIRQHGKFASVMGIILILGELNYLRKYIEVVDFFTKGHSYITCFLAVLITVRSALPYFEKYELITKQFFNSFHLIHFKHQGVYYEKIYKRIDKVSFFFGMYSMAMMVGGMILFNLSPMYHNYKSGAFSAGGNRNMSMMELSIAYVYPGFDPYDHFMFVTIFNYYVSYICAISVCSIDLYLSVMVFQIIGHVLILRHNLENLPKPKIQNLIAVKNFNGEISQTAVEMYDAEENKIISKLIIECVDHHRLIVSFTYKLSDFFGPMLGLNYVFHLVTCCLLLLECSQGDPDALVSFGPLTIIIFGQLIQISITFEVVDTVSSKLKDSVYSMPWECMDIKNRRSVHILLHRMQTPITVTAMGLTSVGVTTMAGILKTTFSYFTFLRSQSE